MNKYLKASNLIYICASLGIHSIFFKKEKRTNNKNLSHIKNFIKLKNIILLTSCEEITPHTKEEEKKKNYNRYHNQLFKNKTNQNNIHIANNEVVNYLDELYKENKNENVITKGDEEEVNFNSSSILSSFVDDNKNVKHKNDKCINDKYINYQYINDQYDSDKCINDQYIESERVEENIKLSEDIINIIENILNKYNVVLFMKGTALNPYCKYSKQAIHILKLNKVKEIHTVNILDNQQLRNALKIYSNWPTFPQLYVNQKFVGGIDKLQELHDQNKFKDII
ncbi:Cg6 protein [Plasmodium sp. gorilla clade G2]|uniref:Cg6 protein n=1 Tax=Plasmodium sp. gorilla clade G2 TaxID=880535 RepID=UPI000D211434|nr:Cg6 protein [Plasmodium sp. gorilla clade G2]SOV12939.1 Cg6 protein [Plasmodium sp. gorilla clade G2]